MSHTKTKQKNYNEENKKIIMLYFSNTSRCEKFMIYRFLCSKDHEIIFQFRYCSQFLNFWISKILEFYCRFYSLIILLKILFCCFYSKKQLGLLLNQWQTISSDRLSGRIVFVICIRLFLHLHLHHTLCF